MIIAFWLDKTDLENLVFVDEAFVKLSIARGLFARAVNGERAINLSCGLSS
ncbi:MAG: hypothetical protein ICV78_01045 [Tolypothrix sp. Co-bin9]|nr:hypothetical protein [Tolypothrix sp. Co-bin9]